MTTHAIDAGAGAARRTSRGELLWLARGAAASFAVSGLFAGVLRWPRPLFLVPYVCGAVVFLWAYVRAVRIDAAAVLRQRWRAGVLGAAVASTVLVANVYAQPASPRAQGAALVAQILWFGVAYGATDGLLLSVLPVLVVRRAWGVGCDADGAARPGWLRRRGVDALAVLASCAITAAYHSGYAEFRGPAMLSAIFGNGVITLSYLATGSPVASVLAHVIMHVAAVLHGPAFVLQLPPH